MYPSPGVVERIGPDWDWVWIDGQHGQIGTYTEMLSMVRACNFIGRKAFVRVAGMLATALHYLVWWAEHLRIRLWTLVMRLPSQRLSIISQKSGKSSQCVG